MCSKSSAAAQPEFFLHTSYTDKLWQDWQQSQPQNANLMAYDGDIDAKLPGTTGYNNVTARLVLNYNAQSADANSTTSKIAVSYSQPTAFDWVNNIVQKVNTTRLQQIPRLKTSSALPYFQQIQAATSLVQFTSQLEQKLNGGPTTTTPYTYLNQLQAISKPTHTAVLGISLSDAVLQDTLFTGDKTSIQQPACGGPGQPPCSIPLSSSATQPEFNSIAPPTEPIVTPDKIGT